MGKLRRIDSELVRRNLARSRQDAQDLLAGGHVFVGGTQVTKPARQIDPSEAVVIQAPTQKWVSRGAHKLLGALEYLGIHAPNLAEQRCLDAGASTGGFTQVLLSAGAKEVVSVDVGYGQLAWQLQQDPRVEILDRTNVRYLSLEQVKTPFDIVVSDLSFISLRLVIPALAEITKIGGELLLMVKPQFEVGKQALADGGVVWDPKEHQSAVAGVAHSAIEANLSVWAIAPSPLPGPAGNVEYFLALQKIADGSENAMRTPRQALYGEELQAAIALAVANGPAGRSTTRGEEKCE